MLYRERERGSGWWDLWEKGGGPEGPELGRQCHSELELSASCITQGGLG